MTHDEMVAVITAHRDGKTIEAKGKDVSTSKWSACDDPLWDFSYREYRVKPEPRVMYIVYTVHGSYWGAYTTMEQANLSLPMKNGGSVSPFKEEL